MYSLYAYGGMMKDQVRMDAYEAALRRAVEPGSVVLDIGTGTGIHALMAARLGAKHVYAIEPADSVLLGAEVARENGYADRITFIQDRSTRVDLPEKADVVVSDLHGVLPWYHHHIPTVVDCRRRLMKEGATLIPQRDVVYAALVEAPDLYSAYAVPWREAPFGFDMEVIAAHLTNNFSRGRVDKEGFLSENLRVCELDYPGIEDSNAATSLTFHPIRAGTMHGFLMWFDTEVLDGIHLTSAPYEPEISYGSAFFPLTRPVELTAEDVVQIDWKAIFRGGDYIWIWNSAVTGSDGSDRASFTQSSFQGRPLSMERLQKRTLSYRPRLNEEAEVLRTAFNLMDGHRSVQEIAQALRSAHPDALSSDEDAIEQVRQLSEHHG